MASPRIVTKFEQIVSGKLLKGKVALVTGASRGAGRGIALVLGECGATVITTGRSMAGKTTDNRPETVEETAKLVTERGGQGVAIHCDHSNAAEVKNLFERVIKDYGRLDILVNNAWSGNKGYDGEKYTDGTRFDTPFWEGHALNRWHDMIDNGVKNHLLASHAAAPIMVGQKSGLIVTTSFHDDAKYIGNVYYDLAKAAMNRLAFGMAQDLKKHNVASIALSPGWMRTEIVVDVGHDNTQTESTEYIGRAVASLACDEDVMSLISTPQLVGELADRYDFTDIDGRKMPPFRMP